MIRVSLSFDDGRKDNYDIARPILLHYGLTATFNITTGYVDGTYISSTEPCPNAPMTIENIISLYNDGFEIAGHSDKHTNEIHDIELGQKKIHEWLGISYGIKIGFASPHSLIMCDDDSEQYRNVMTYMRIGPRNTSGFINRVERRVANLTGSRFLYSHNFRASLGRIENSFLIYSIPVMHHARVYQVQRILETALKEQKDCVLMFHSILKADQPFYSDTYSWDVHDFKELCEWLSEKQFDNRIRVVGTSELIETKINE